MSGTRPRLSRDFDLLVMLVLLALVVLLAAWLAWALGGFPAPG